MNISTSKKLDTLEQVKSNIKNAIEEKGVEITDDTTFIEYAEKISEIQGGGEKIPLPFNNQYKFICGSSYVGSSSGSCSKSNLDFSNGTLYYFLNIWCPDVSIPGTVSISVNGNSNIIDDYDNQITDTYYQIRVYKLKTENNISSAGASFSGISVNSASIISGYLYYSDKDIILNAEEASF